MNEFNRIIEKYNNFSPCLMKIKDNPNDFKNITHPFIFCYLIGYFYKNNININDFNNILHQYQNDIFTGKDFFTDFKSISYIFSDYFEKEEQKNNNNNFNNFYDFNKTNEINNIKENFNKTNEINNINENFNILSNSNKQIDKNIDYNINSIDDYEMAMQLEEQEKIMLQIRQEQDALNQSKKCEICLENFSLLDCTNYFLNCNCILHNKCFDEMVKSAVESNSLPVKCPNCGTPIHPNFILN